ncbi:EF-hand calcium-binding domain-containing protein 14-like [Rhinoraja longicauda]
MPEPKKAEKYVLLNDDSDCETEEFNKMKMSPMDSRSANSGRKYTASKAGRCSAWCQPQWVCHSFFIFVLLTTQVFLFLCILRVHQEIQMIKMEQTIEPSQRIDNQLHSEGTGMDGNANLNHRLEDLYKKFEEIRGLVSQDKNGTSTERPEHNLQEIQVLDQRINITQESIIRFEENLKSLQARCEKLNKWVEIKPTGNQDLSRLYRFMHKLNGSTVSSLLRMKDEIHEFQNLTFHLTDKFRTMEISLHSVTELTNSQTTELDQFEESLVRLINISAKLKSHQGRLERNLNSNYRQISQLRDLIYQTEDALNQTDQPASIMAHLQAENITESPQQLNTNKIPWLISQEEDVKPDNHTSTTEETILATTARNVILIPSITNLKALRSFFYEADWRGRGYLTYEDLMSNLGTWAPPGQEIKKFDVNNDDRYTYMEMVNALGLQE